MLSEGTLSLALDALKEEVSGIQRSMEGWKETSATYKRLEIEEFELLKAIGEIQGVLEEMAKNRD